MRRGAPAVAGRGRPAQPGRLAHRRRQAPGDRRMAPPRAARRAVRRDGPRPRAAGRRGIRHVLGPRHHRRRRAATRLRGLPPGALARGADRAHAAHRRRPQSREEIARAFLVPVATIQQRIVRAKKTLAAANVPFEVPEPQDYAERLGSVLSVLYLIFNEGYLPASGEQWVRPDVSAEALRLARMVARADAARARGAVARGAHGVPRVAVRRARRARRHADPARPAGPRALGPRADRARPGRARAGRPRSGVDARRTGCRRRSPSATRSRRRPRTPTGPASCCSTRRSVASRRRPWSS